MTEDQEKAIRGSGFVAGEIAAMAEIIAEALTAQADPDTASKAEALCGLSRMARTLSDSLLSVSEAA